MRYGDLTDEQKSKVASAKSPEEILEMAEAEGYELTDEELEQIAGGGFWKDEYYCPKCGSHHVSMSKAWDEGLCLDCGFEGWYDSFYH